MANQADLKPMAQGSFLKTPFAHILVFLFDKRMTGTLDVKRGQEEISVYFCDGMPAKVKTTVKDRGLGHVLQWLGLITQAELDACDASGARETGLLGQRLVGQGVIDMERLMRGLREQMLLKLTDVFALRDADYAFYEKANLLSGFGPDEVFPIHPFPVIMAGVRAYSNILDFDAALAKISDKWLTLNAEIETIRLYRLKAQEKQVVSALLGGDMRTEALLTGDAWDPKVARYVLYVLLITKTLAVSDAAPLPEERAGSPSARFSSASFSSVPPDIMMSEDPALIAFKKQILDKAKEITTQSYYEMLEVTPEATIEEVRRAFFGLSKLYHPERMPPELKSSMRYTVKYLYSNLSEAHSVLIDPARRDAYYASRGRGMVADTEEQTTIRNALDAENMFQRALVYLNQKKYDLATEAVSEARALSPEEGEYLGLATHLDAMKRPDGAPHGDLVEKMREASDKCPKSERVTFFMAELLKQVGRPNEARNFYERVLEINPHNILAGRAVRLIDLEKRKQAESKSSGIFKRIFK